MQWILDKIFRKKLWFYHHNINSVYSDYYVQIYKFIINCSLIVDIIHVDVCLELNEKFYFQ